MIMMFTSHDMLVARLTIMQQDFTGQAGFNKQFQGSIDCCLTDTRIAGLYLKVQLFDADVLMGGKKNIKNNITLTGGTQTLAGSKFVECFFLFQDHSHPPIEHDYQY